MRGGELNSYERVMSVLKGGGKVDFLPCVNFSSTCTREFMEYTGAWWPEAHMDPVKMARLGAAAHKLCCLDNVTVPFDTLVEAEVFGVPVDFHEGYLAWPSIKRPLLKRVVPPIPPGDVARSGRVPVVAEAVRLLKEEFEGAVPVNVLVVPPFTSTSYYVFDHTSFMMTLERDPGAVKEVLDEVVDVYVEIVDTYVDAGADVITLCEMGGSASTLPSMLFDELVVPYVRKMAERANVSVLSIPGEALPLMDRVTKCNVNGVAIDHNTPISGARKILDYSKPGYPLIGNIDPVEVLYEGPEEKIRIAVKKAIEDGVSMVAPGSDFWIETPTRHVSAMVEATRTFSRRSEHCSSPSK
ncbi:MAG: uroporphyrinogen decarboxylase family protein [Candidatus Jordarchaeales archaeon]